MQRWEICQYKCQQWKQKNKRRKKATTRDEFGEVWDINWTCGMPKQQTKRVIWRDALNEGLGEDRRWRNRSSVFKRLNEKTTAHSKTQWGLFLLLPSPLCDRQLTAVCHARKRKMLKDKQICGHNTTQHDPNHCDHRTIARAIHWHYLGNHWNSPMMRTEAVSTEKATPS